MAPLSRSAILSLTLSVLLMVLLIPLSIAIRVGAGRAEGTITPLGASLGWLYMSIATATVLISMWSMSGAVQEVRAGRTLMINFISAMAAVICGFTMLLVVSP